MTQPNEQLIETIEKALLIENPIPVTWIVSQFRALLEENKRLRGWVEKLQDVHAVELFSEKCELQQIREELEVWKESSKNQFSELFILRTELSAKDKVLLDIKCQIEQSDHPAGLGILTSINAILSQCGDKT